MKRLKVKKYYLLASFFVLVATFIIYKGLDSLFFSKEEVQYSQLYQVPITQIPVLKSLLEIPPQTDTQEPTPISDLMQQPELQFTDRLTAKSAYVVDVDTGTVLFDRNSERILLPASTTKLMTALVALEEYDLDTVITVPQLPAIEGLRYDFKLGSQILVRNLLKAALIQSSNDAAYILAIASENGLEGFVEEMNVTAKELNLKSTHYKNPAGFDDDTQRSSARDLVILSREIMKNEFLQSVVSTEKTMITDITQEFEMYLYTTHHLLGVDPTVIGIKTGTTEGASQVLVTQFLRDGHNIVIVIMGSDDRYLETTQLIDWVFESYQWVTPDELVNTSI
jgi:D-alanyl-D-alanine carboxypeptidase (penicillin-binding protein 5/6)